MKIHHRRILIGILVIFPLILSLVIYRNITTNYVEYQIDEVNTCTWRNGKVDGSTLVGGSQHNVKVKQSEEKAFLQKAATDGLCATKL